MKSSNISYSANPLRKTISVPLLSGNFQFGTEMTDPIWQFAASADDFVRFREETRALEYSARFAVFRTEKELCLGCLFQEPENLRTVPHAEATSPWAGDIAEFHFGSVAPDPWHIQLAVGISGLRFDSTGGYDRWECRPFQNPEGWGVELRIPLELLPLTEGGMLFDICWDFLQAGERVVWSALHRQYHELENYGELLFGKYEDVAYLRTGKPYPANMTRSQFEQARQTWEIPATRITNGPYLTFPEADSLCVTWKTAGLVPAYVEYWLKNHPAEIRRADCARQGGILVCESLHFARLSALQPDADYEYRLVTLFPVLEEKRESAIRQFHTPPASAQDFSFLLFSDLHSRAQFLRNLMATPEAASAAFHISLGDNLSHLTGREGLFTGIINPLVEANQKRPVDIPLVFVRGNHEQLGTYAGEYFHVMRHPTGRTFFTFMHGDVFFLALDSGNDFADTPERPLFANHAMMADEQEFLKEVFQSPNYRQAGCRILLVHIPPMKKFPWVQQLIATACAADIRPDLMICGHQHRFARINGANANKIRPNTERPDSAWANEMRHLPFPTVLNACETAVVCRKNGDRLSVKTIEQTPEGPFQERDFFTISL